MTLTGSARAWIESQLDARVVSVEKQARWRPHYFLTVERDGVRSEVLARGERDADPGGRSKFLTHFDIAREARVLKALQGQGIKVPTYLGYSDEHRMLLMEKVAGSNLLAGAADDAQRLSVMKQYFEQLARLHALDIDALDLEGIDVPATPEDVAFAGKFRYIEEDYRRIRPNIRPDPLLDLGVWWLHQNVPAGDRRVSFIQGDTGPGQFMFSRGELTALIDWELAHIADPMLDLGVVRMRNMLYPTGPLSEPIAHYEAISGKPIDRPALTFYTVLSMLLTPLGLVQSVQRPSARVPGMLPRFGWHTTLRRGLCDALAEALCVEIDPPDLPEPADADPTFTSFLVEDLELHGPAMARDDHERMNMQGAIAVARLVHRDEAIGASLRDADLTDMRSVLAGRPRDLDAGFAQLNELVLSDPSACVVELVRLFARIERRREHLWAPLMVAQDSAPFEPLGLLAPLT